MYIHRPFNQSPGRPTEAQAYYAYTLDLDAASESPIPAVNRLIARASQNEPLLPVALWKAAISRTTPNGQDAPRAD